MSNEQWAKAHYEHDLKVIRKPYPGGQDVLTQFEEWALGNNFAATKWPNGDYIHESMRLAWKAWQHLAARQPVRQEPFAVGGWVLLPRDPVAALPCLHALADAAGLERLPDREEDGYPITGQQSTVRKWYAEILDAAPPAQAVDLAENILSVLIEEDVLARDGRVFQKLRALIDSQGKNHE